MDEAGMKAGSKAGTARAGHRGLPSVGAWATMLTLWLPVDLASAEATLTAAGPGVFLPPPCQQRPAECLTPPSPLLPPGHALPDGLPTSSAP